MYYEIVVNLIVNILRVALMKRVMDTLLPPAEGKAVKAALAVCYGVTVAVYSRFHISAVYEACSLACVLGVTLLYRDTWRKRLWAAASFLCMDMGSFLAVYFVFREEGRLQQPAIGVLLLLVCVVSVSRIFGPNTANERTFDGKQMLLLILVPVIGILELLCLQYADFPGTKAAGICLSVLAVNLCVFCLYRILAENYVRLREQDVYIQQTYAYQNQLEVIMESQSRIRALKHDMKNHVLTLQALARDAQSGELREYLASMQEFMTNPSEHVFTGNEALDSLLNYKLQRAKESLKTVETDIVIPKEMRLQSFDLNVIVGNLLDNAIAASEQTEERLLRLRMRMEKGLLFLDMVNSCSGMPEGVCDMEKMAENSAEGHGIGLANVRRIVEKYHGEIDMSCSGHRMKTEVMLYMKAL